ncbi:MAG: hypothetical protein IT373_21535, partial [Polyangiaceae bacterium]|nr:hypothetical protein [Polyangiaceae bacterium]
QRCLTTLARQAEASTDEQVGIRRDFLELGAEQVREITRTATPAAVEKACTNLFSELKKYACDG